MKINTLSKLALSMGLISQASAEFDASSNSNVAVYWGQASAGSQEDLSYYCESDDVDIVLLAFMTAFPGTDDVPTLNFASACNDEFSDGLLDCTQIASDIETCQSAGKKVMLSLGGSAGSYGFTDDSEAEEFAGTLWDMFGEGNATERPFGESVVDGFDFDIENNDATGYASLATKLREYFADGSKDYYLSAAPQCVYPDASLGDALENADFDFAFVQFYNNNCNVDKTFNWDTWTSYATDTSPNKDIKIYLGLPASSSAASSGYIDIDTVKSTLETISGDSSFGGVMLWDASQGFTNEVDDDTTYVAAVKDALNSLSGSSSSAVESSSSSTAKSSSSTKVASSSTTTLASSAIASSSDTTVSSAAETSSTKEQSSTAAVSTSSSSAVASTSNTDIVSSSAVSLPGHEETQTISLSQAVTSNASSYSLETTSTQPGGPISSATQLSVSNTASISAQQTTTSAPSQQTAPSAPSQQTAPGQETSPASPDSPFTELTLNTFSSNYVNTLTTIHVSTTLQITTTSSSTLATSSATSSSSSSDCSSLSGQDQVDCLNAQYEAGNYGGSATSCATNGEGACTSDGKYAVCNWGTWVVEGCAAGTTCHAALYDNAVWVGCDWPTNSKRSLDHAHHDH